MEGNGEASANPHKTPEGCGHLPFHNTDSMAIGADGQAMTAQVVHCPGWFLRERQPWALPPKGEAVLPKAGVEAAPKTDEDDAAAPKAG